MGRTLRPACGGGRARPPGQMESRRTHWAVAILVGAALAAMALLFWRHVRLAEADAALQQSMLQRGLTPDEIERLLSCPSEPPPAPATEEQAVGELATCLHQSGVSETVMEQVFAAVRDTEAPMRQALCHALRGLAGEAGDEATEKEMLAAIRGLCGNSRPPAGEAASPALRSEPTAATDRPRD